LFSWYSIISHHLFENVFHQLSSVLHKTGLHPPETSIIACISQKKRSKWNKQKHSKHLQKGLGREKGVAVKQKICFQYTT
jgi:hypothetical protein